jgi:hypothetical protein
MMCALDFKFTTMTSDQNFLSGRISHLSISFALYKQPSGSCCREQMHTVMSTDSIHAYSPTEVKLKWRHEQLNKHRLLLLDIDGSWRRKQLECCEGLENVQGTFPRFDISWDSNSQPEASHSESIEGFGCKRDGVCTFSTKSFKTHELAWDMQEFGFGTDRAVPVEPTCEAMSVSFPTANQTTRSIPCLSGWAMKQRKPRRFGLQIFQRWKACWFVVAIEGGSLVMNRYDGEAYATPKSSVCLCPVRCALREMDLDGRGRFCFSLALAGGEQRILLCASSRQQADHWTEVLNSVAEDLCCSTSRAG